MNARYDFTSLWNSLAAGADVLVISSAKAIVLLGIAGLIALAFKNASAATRHGIWSFALASVLVLLPLSLLMPSWSVEVLPQKALSYTEQATPLPEPAPKADVRPEASARASASALVLEKADKAILAAPVPRPEPVPSVAAQPAPEVARAETSLMSSAFEAAREISWAGWAMLFWATGVAAVLMYFLLGTARAWWWTRRAEPVRDEAWTALAKDISWELCLKKPVRLVWSDRAAMPMAWGFLRPIVLLPRSASAWTSERRRVVLLHEMAHIQRSDNLTQALAQFACTLYWFNPFVWWGARQLRIERERACDDQVITRGTKPSTYATHLIAIARSLRATPGTPLGAVSMARPSQLEGRLLAILEPSLSRRTLSRARTIFTGVLFAAAIFPLAAMQPGAEETASGGDESQRTLSYSYTINSDEAAASPDDTVYEKSFEVSPGGLLTIRTDLGSIEVRTHDAERVDIKATIEGQLGILTEYADLVSRRQAVQFQLAQEKVDRKLLEEELERTGAKQVSDVTSGIDEQIDLLNGKIAELHMEAEEFYAATPSLRGNEASEPKLQDILDRKRQFEATRENLSVQLIEETLGSGAAGEEQLSYAARLRTSVIEKELNLDRLQVELAAIDTRISSYEKRQGSAPDQAWGSDDFMLYFEQNGDDVLVRGEQKEKEQRNQDGDRLRVEYVVTVPSRFKIDLQTADGSISVEDLEGTVEKQASGSSRAFGILGDSQAQTFDGSTNRANAEGTSAQGSNSDEANVSPTSPDDEVIERIFEVSPGGTLNVRTDRGSIEVATSDADQVAVRVEIEARSEEDRERFELSFEQNGDDVSVEGEVENRGRWNWNGDRLRIKYLITVPSQYNVDLQTSGGSIAVEDLEGEVVTQTSGGSLSFGMIRGDIKGRTSGGSISLDGTSGNADVHTSGGSISLGKVAGTVKARTSGGSITIDEVAGTIDAETSGGSIRAAITEQPEGDCELRTSGGSITVRLADGIGVDLNAKTSAGRVTTEFDVPPRDKDEMDELEASINGGGPMLRLRTSAGSVRINRLNGGTSMDRESRDIEAGEEVYRVRQRLAGLLSEGATAEEIEAAKKALNEAAEAHVEEALEARQEAEEERQEAMEEQQEAIEEALMEAEEAHAEAMMEMEEAMREMNMEIGDAVEEAMAEIDMDEVGEAIEEAMEEFAEAMEEMGEELAEAFEDGDLPSGNISGSINGVNFSGTIAEVMRAMKENFDAEGFAEQVEQSALEGVASAFEEMAYEKDSVKVINDDREEWRDPLDVIAELPAEYAVPALERVAENHEDQARREKAARLADKAKEETPEEGQ